DLPGEVGIAPTDIREGLTEAANGGEADLVRDELNGEDSWVSAHRRGRRDNPEGWRGGCAVLADEPDS
ncbi:MAG: hypothetical protein O7J95_14555, partial [Planctomycetota bacterium]|nr:hypothetical protein [Planctomycetota bacterium]